MNSGQNNVIIGSENIDSIIADRYDGAAILDEMLSILLEGGKDRTTAVVVYRAPRLKHLISLWKELEANNPPLKNTSFMDFLFHSQSYSHFHTIDSLALVGILVNKGMNVTLADIEGLIKHKVEFYQLLLCDLMQECDENMTPTFFNRMKPDQVSFFIKRFTKKVNVRSNGIMDLPKNKLDDIEDAMQLYDCRYKYLLGHKYVRIIHDNSLVTNLQKCKNEVDTSRRKKLWEDIKMIADPDKALIEKTKKLILLAGPHFSGNTLMVSVS